VSITHPSSQRVPHSQTTYMGELYVDAGEKEKALTSLRKALKMYQEMGITGYWLARTEKALEKLKAQ
jgi:hypothetical protein